MSTKTKTAPKAKTKETAKAKTFTPVTGYIQNARRVRRAYWGLHGLAFERAQMRWEQAREITENLFEDCIAKGEELEAKAGDSFKDTRAKLRDGFSETEEKVRDILPFGGNRVEELEAELAKLTAMLKKIEKPVKTRKPVAKKPAAKKVASKTVKTVTAPVEDKYAPFIADVLRYDDKADSTNVTKIVNHLGIALQSRDGQFVACSDETERHTVRDSWLVKKLGLTGETADLDAAVMTVCETMQEDRMKNRVTFYYIAAKNAGKLAAL